MLQDKMQSNQIITTNIPIYNGKDEKLSGIPIYFMLNNVSQLIFTVEFTINCVKY